MRLLPDKTRARMRGDDVAQVDHLAYLARQRVAIAQATSGQKGAEAAVARADTVRDKVRLAARTNEADSANRQAADATLMANDAQRLAAETQARNAQLEAQINGLNAKKTDRGLVMTIGDVLFDTDRAQLKEGGLRSIDKLADFLKAYPQRTALVEGYTDSTGSEAHNEALSSRRATSVRAALLERGVGGDRVSMKGYGEAYPVAGNDSSGGRQLNRRVEIVLSDEAGRTVSR
jgi:outer membrane protein OmpA-like peptidoglycan-associated protein